jgi:hypothetical protein
MGYVLKDKNMIAAIINQETNIVENLAVVADFNWDPGYGLYMVVLEENESCDIGQIYNADDIPRFSGAPTIRPKIYATHDFLLRFTPEERAAARAAALTDPIIADFQQLSQVVPTVDNTNQDTINGMQYLVSAGVITQARYDEIMG